MDQGHKKTYARGREVADSNAGVQGTSDQSVCGAAVASGWAYYLCPSSLFERPSPIVVFEIPSKIRNWAHRLSHLRSSGQATVSRDGWRLCKWRRCTRKYPGRQEVSYALCVHCGTYVQKQSRYCSPPKALHRERRRSIPLLCMKETQNACNAYRTVRTPPHIRDQYNCL